MKTIKNILILFLSTTMLFISAGCWSAKEMQDLAIVMGIAFDYSPNPAEYYITVQIARPSGLGTNQAAGNSNERFFNEYITSTGISQGLGELDFMISRSVYIGHTEIVAICDDVAKNGMTNLVDFFTRSTPLRLSIPLVVCRGNAAKFFEQDTRLETLPATRMNKILWTQDMGPSGRNNTIADFLSDYLAPTMSATLPILNLEGDELTLDGTAVFNGLNMVGELDLETSKVMFLVLGEYDDDDIFTKLPDNEFISFDVRRNDSTITPLYENGQFGIYIDIYIVAIINESSINIDITSTDKREAMERLISEEVSDRILNLISQTRELNADILGLGEILYNKYPKEFTPLIDDWNSEYQNLPITVHVDTMLESSGSSTGSLS